MRKIVILLAVLGALAACDDEETKVTDAAVDARVPRDGAVASDQGAVSDQGAASDQSAAGLTCEQVLNCGLACGDLGCVQGCIARGCDSARDLAGPLLLCIQVSCSGTRSVDAGVGPDGGSGSGTVELCNLDPGGEACQQCILTECGEALAACRANTCS